MLKFAKNPVYIPDPARPRPVILNEHKAQAAEDPPWPVPFHCKPWVDGQTVGWTLFYGYLTPVTIETQADGRIAIGNYDELVRETQQAKIIHQFIESHFSVSTGYHLQTPPGFSSLLVPALRAPEGLTLLSGVVETDWYSRTIFAVFERPPVGQPIHLEYRTELVRVVIVPRHEGLKAEPFNEAEMAQLEAQEETYAAEESDPQNVWEAASGDSFSHVYKIWSKRFRNSGRLDGEGEGDA